MTCPSIRPETAEYRDLLRTLSTRSDAAHMVSVAEFEMAERLARETGRELYRIDLSTIISKYIGQTEKNFDGLDQEVPVGVVLIVETRETVTSSVDVLPVLHKLSERTDLIIFVIDEPKRLPDRLPTLLKAHIQSAGGG